MKKKTKIIFVVILSVVVFLFIGIQIRQHILRRNVEQARQELNYTRRLRVLDAKEDVSMMYTAEYYVPVQVGEKLYYYDTATAYINWRNYCYETNDDKISYERFVEVLLNPEETPEAKAIMKWVDVMNGTANTLKTLAEFSGYLHTEAFLDKYPNQDWPDIVYACNLEQLDILFNYDLEIRGW